MSHHDSDERPLALRDAETASGAWSAAARHQQRSTPRHADFYALAGEMVTTLYALDDLTVLLAAVGCLRDVRAGLATVAGAANAFWSAIGHIGVEVTP